MNDASDKPFNQINFSGMPNMAGTLSGWNQKLTFGLITETIENFESVQRYTEVIFQGNWQPLETRKINLKPEHQRSLSWYQVHSLTNVHLKNDDIIQFRGIQYRVMAQWDYSINGYYEYHIVEDYTGSGPTKIEPEVP